MKRWVVAALAGGTVAFAGRMMGVRPSVAEAVLLTAQVLIVISICEYGVRRRAEQRATINAFRKSSAVIKSLRGALVTADDAADMLTRAAEMMEEGLTWTSPTVKR